MAELTQMKRMPEPVKVDVAALQQEKINGLNTKYLAEMAKGSKKGNETQHYFRKLVYGAYKEGSISDMQYWGYSQVIEKMNYKVLDEKTIGQVARYFSGKTTRNGFARYIETAVLSGIELNELKRIIAGVELQKLDYMKKGGVNADVITAARSENEQHKTAIKLGLLNEFGWAHVIAQINGIFDNTKTIRAVASKRE